MIPYRIREFMAKFTLSRFVGRPRKLRIVTLSAPRQITVLISPQDASHKTAVKDSATILLQHFGNIDLKFYTYNPRIKKEAVYSERFLHVLDPMDVNWYLKPNDMRPAHADILFDCTRKPHIPLRFFTLFSHAKLKAGVATIWNENQLDLMFELPEKFELTYVCTQFIHYFEQLKQKN